MAQQPIKRKSSINVIQEAPTSKILRRTISQQSESPDLRISNNQFLDKITAIWKTTSLSAKNLLSREGQDVKTKIKEDEDKYVKISKIVQLCQKELETLENNVSELRIDFKKNANQNQNLKEKHADALQLSEMFTQYVSCINNTLSRCKNHAEILEKMYKDVVFKLREDVDLLSKKIDKLNRVILRKKEKPNVCSKQIESELMELKIEGKVLENNILQQKEELQKIKNKIKINYETIESLQICRNKVKNSIEELEKSQVEEENKTREQRNSIEESKIKELKESYEMKLSVINEELNETKLLMNSIQEHKQELLNKYLQKEKLVDESEKNYKKYSSQTVDVTTDLNEVTVAIQQSSEENVILEGIMNEVHHNFLIKKNELDLMSREKNNSPNELKKLNDEIKREEEETKQLLDELQTTEVQLREAIQQSDCVDKEVQNYQESKELKVADLQKELESTKEAMKSVANDNKKIKLSKNKLEREYKKESKIQTDKYNECLTNLNNLMSSNDKTAKELTASKKALHSLKIDNQKVKEEYAKWQKTVENKLISANKATITSNSEKQLKATVSQLRTNLKELEKKRQQLKTEAIKTSLLRKSLSNVQQTHESLLKPFTYQSQNQPIKGGKIRILESKIVEKKVKSILKPQASLKSPKSPGRKLKFSEPLSTKSQMSLDCFDISLIDEKNDNLSQKTINSPRFQLSASQGSSSRPTSPATPTQKKFFKSRGTS